MGGVCQDGEVVSRKDVSLLATRVYTYLARFPLLPVLEGNLLGVSPHETTGIQNRGL